MDSLVNTVPYFVLSWTSFLFTIVFGLWLLLIRIFTPQALGEREKKMSHLSMFYVGAASALNGLLVVFASPGSRTAPYLQAVLGRCRFLVFV